MTSTLPISKVCQQGGSLTLTISTKQATRKFPLVAFRSHRCQEIIWVCFKSLGLRALIKIAFALRGVGPGLTDRKSTSNRNDLARAVIFTSSRFKCLGSKPYRGVSASTVYSMVSLAFDHIILPVSLSPTTDPLHPALSPQNLN
jgi:hypothetical protein